MLTAFIPAKSSSKRIKNKNIIDVGGKPLFEWTFDICKLFKAITKVVVATDIPEIIESSKLNGFELFNLEDCDINDQRTVRQLWKYFAAMNKGDQLLLQPTAPFRLIKDLIDGWELYKKTQADVVIGVKKEHDILINQYGKSLHDNTTVLSQNRQLNYYITAAFWISSSNYLTSVEDLQCGNVQLIEVHPISWIDINTQTDLEFARIVANGLKH